MCPQSCGMDAESEKLWKTECCYTDKAGPPPPGLRWLHESAGKKENKNPSKKNVDLSQSQLSVEDQL